MSTHIEPLRSPLRVALIGAGKMGLHHLAAIKSVPGASVVAIADPTANAEALRAVTSPDLQVFADAKTMFETARPDVVHIVTPPGSHAALGRLAVQHGAHVYIEKPFTPTHAEAAALLAEAAQAGVSVCAGHQCLFERPSVAALDELRRLGTLVHVESVFAFRKVRRNITHVEQAIDILPHAVYPLLAQLRWDGLDAPLELKGLDVRNSGDVYALVRIGDRTGIIVVTLSGRPVEQYQHLVGTNGWLRADYIAGSLTRIVGPGAGPGVLLVPYRRSRQTFTGAARGLASLIFGGHGSYPGLVAITAAFYRSIVDKQPSPVPPSAILDTVDLCERIGVALAATAVDVEAEAQRAVTAAAAALAAPTKGRVLVTGGSGFLGRAVVEELRADGWAVRSLGRRVPPWPDRVPGIDYVTADLAQPLPPAICEGVDAVVHCAAETAGGKSEHERNSIGATRHVVEGAIRAGAKQLIHVSSVAVLVPGRGKLVSEATPVDAGHLRRGPYVWGKAESERIAIELARDAKLPAQVIRLGPLVDYADFEPPGRLGRDAGAAFVAVGPKRRALSVCDIYTAARVIRSYLDDPKAAPPLLNLVESPAPARMDLVARLRERQPGVRVFWLPAWVLRLASGPLKLIQRWGMSSKEPLDIAAAFSSERYDTSLAGQVIERAGPSAIPGRRTAGLR
jgi:predicted dehydrogenase/nucleoside-diphosphate-sugar epimerase